MMTDCNQFKCKSYCEVKYVNVNLKKKTKLKTKHK